MPPKTLLQHEPILAADGTMYTAWTDGYAIGFKCEHVDGRVEFIYLNPSSSTDGKPNVFLYQGGQGDPAADAALHYYNIMDEERRL